MSATTTATTASAVNASDFRSHTNLPHRDMWTYQAMQCLVDVLDGTPVVAITLDTMTGHTVLNASLVALRQTPGYGTFQVLVQSQGSDRRVWHPLAKVGTIIMPNGGPRLGYRYQALDEYRERGHAAEDSREARIQRYGLLAVEKQEREIRERLARINTPKATSR